MAKEIAIGKRAKISEAQQYIILSVLGASLFLGAAIALVSHFIQQISFNVEVIMAEDESISAYSSIIKTTGICEPPKGANYTNEELNACSPDTIDISKIPGTLRANILTSLAANDALNSVPKQSSSSCINPATNRNYTYQELNRKYRDATTSSELAEASQLIKSCSALRIIPDALPAFKNEEALLASLNQLFLTSGWEPESLSPSGTTVTSPLGINLNAMSVNLSVEANTATTMTVLSNIERSIREFDIERATIEWGGNDTLVLRAQATAYYMDKSSISEHEQTKTMQMQEDN